MSPRRHWLPLLSALALLLAPLALPPRAAEAQGSQYIVDRDDDVEVDGGCTNPLDNDDCTFRQALILANDDAGASNITFDASLIGSVITLADPNVPLPALTASNTTISGAAGEQSGTPNIAIDGNGSELNGLTITGSGNLVASLSVYGFACSSELAGGIVIQGAGATNNRVERNYIGLTLDGGVPATRNCNGVVISGGASGNRVQNFNVISGNAFDGVLIRNASDNLVLGNRIGLSPDASQAARGNQRNGVNVTSNPGDVTERNVIGSSAVNTDRNVISGNGTGTGNAGVRIFGSGTLTTTVAGNVIGLNSAGVQDRGNTGDGIIVLNGPRATTIQGTTNSALVVSGNDANGIRVTGSGTRNTTISGVYVGTTGAGTGVVGNAFDGVRVDTGATGTTISGGTSTNRTLIAGNGFRGVYVDGAATAGTRVENSLIGAVIAATTSAPQPNVLGGVLINNAVRATVSGNTISGNAAFGLRLSGTDTVTVTANFVGLSLDRTAAQGNAGPGIELQNARNTLVGGTPSVQNSPVNFIAGNQGPGVLIGGSGSVSVTLRGNQVGLLRETSSNNFLVRGANGGEGVLITGGAKRVTLEGNTLAGSADTTAADFPGVRVQGDGSSGPSGGISSTNVATVTVSGNRIGWMPTSTAANAPVLPFPNSDGIAVAGGARNVAISLNTVRLNLGAGIRLTDAISATVQDNIPLARNLGGGVVVEGASSRLTLLGNQIVESGRDVNNAVVNGAADGILFTSGGAALRGAQVLSNTLRANTGRGIALQGNVQRVTLRFNRLAQNGGAISLAGSTRYPGSGPDADTTATPNHGIDGPVVDLSFTSPLALRVNQAGFVEGYVYTNTGTVRPISGEADITPASACITCTIQVFRPDRTLPPESQGWELIRTIPEAGGASARDFISVGANGRFSARIQDTLPGRLLFIATDGFGNSSEYVTLPLTASLVLEPVAPPSLAQNAAPGDTVTYTLRLRNTGTLDYSNLRIQTGGTLPRWLGSTTPITGTTFGLGAGASRLVTVTLRLPTGADPSVVAGIRDTTRITITGGPPPVTGTARLETTVLPRPVVSVTPRSSLGSGRPGTVVPHAFTITNNGNVTVTLDIAARTADPANSPGTWSTNVSTRTLNLGPGQNSRLGVSVTVPTGALQNVAATTFLTATVRAGTPPGPVFPGGQTVVFSATTRAELNPNADLFPDVETVGAAGGQVSLVHTVENKSNGTATFCLDYFSSSRTTVRFESATNGFVVNSQGCFTLYAGADINPSQGRFGIAQIRAIATIDRRLTSGDIDLVTIFLRRGSPTGESISDATVEDRIRITVGEKIPRLWLPIVRQNQPQP